MRSKSIKTINDKYYEPNVYTVYYKPIRFNRLIVAN